MIKGTRVKWHNAVGVEGLGEVISDTPDAEYVLVAVDAEPMEAHYVIWCPVTWLTEID